MSEPRIGIYGANGHTGRLMAAELLARGEGVVLAGRNAGALHALAGELDGPVRTHVASVEDPKALRELAESVDVLIHCAGPYSWTGEPVAGAAVEGGCHYIDHAVESPHVKRLFDTLQEGARRAEKVMLPGFSFYGGFGDLLAAAVAEGTADVDSVTVGYAVTGWRMTTGAKNTAELLIGDNQRLTFTDGTLRIGHLEPYTMDFDFPAPLGTRTMIAPFPSGEVVTVPRHIPARTVLSLLTADTFAEDQVFTSEGADAAERARNEFTVAVRVSPGDRVGSLSGQDIWAVSAICAGEAAVRLADGERPAESGVLSPAEAFPAAPFLRALEQRGAFTLTL
jgi:short subunit dehydrogenase-like uncharacterized protein